MADMLVVCGKCGAENTLSEYVDPDQAFCRCGAKLEIARTEVTGPREPPKKKQRAVATGPSALEKTTTAALAASKARRSRVRKRKAIISWTPSVLTTWIIFVVGTVVLCLLRFVLLSGTQNDAARTAFINGGLVCLMVLHFTIVVDAFADNILTGLLCLIIPGYSIFYLYTMCDAYILRVAVGVLLLPFGLDITLKIYAIASMGLGWLKKTAMFGTYE